MEPFEILAVELLDQKHAIRFQANGSSMRPFILNGDILEVQPLSRRSLKPGEIVFYRQISGRLLVHRVIRVCGDKLLIQGDAQLEPDGWKETAQVLGTAAALTRQGRRIDLTSPWSRACGRLWVALTPLRCRLQPGIQTLWHKLRSWFGR